MYSFRCVVYVSLNWPYPHMGHRGCVRIVYIGSAADGVLEVLTVLITHTYSYSKVNSIRVIGIWHVIIVVVWVRD